MYLFIVLINNTTFKIVNLYLYLHKFNSVRYNVNFERKFMSKVLYYTVKIKEVNESFNSLNLLFI